MTPKTRLDKAAILEAAAALAEETGIHNLTLSRVAARLGIKSPSLYNHIAGLNDLICGLAGLGLKRMGEALRNAAVGKSRKDALRAVAAEFRRFAKANPELYRTVIKLPELRNGELKESVDELVQILNAILEPYHYKKEDAMHIIRIWKSALHGFVSLESAGFFKNQCDIEESFQRMVSCIIAGQNTR
jgi:AcrR family transcriptional regulator